MIVKKILVCLTFVFFVMDRRIEGDNTNYSAWIIIFLFWIATNTIQKDKE